MPNSSTPGALTDQAANLLLPATAPKPTQDFTDPKFFAPSWAGERYYVFFQRLHNILKPKNYLEIGIQKGGSLKIANCPVIGIDPAYRIAPEILNSIAENSLFRCTSDDFFKNHDPKILFGAPISLAFLDGMHLFEFLLRDFMNTELHCNSDSIIILHDCLPTDLGMTRRDSQDQTGPTRKLSHWAGDVWKMLPTLRKYRPSLKILALDAPPTGLVLISGLNPKDTTLRECYDDILKESEKWNLRDIGVQAYISSQNVESTRSYSTKESLMARLNL